MECRNEYCKYHIEGNECEVVDDLVIDNKGKCANYERGFMYYFFHATEVLKSNFLCIPEVTDDVRYSIYYLMRCLPIEFATDDIRGILVLRDSENHNLLTGSDILDMIRDRLNEEELHKCIMEFNENGLPDMHKETEEDKEVEYKGYGWLSPSGEFTEADFGDHEKAAYQILKRKTLIDRNGLEPGMTYRDYLSEVIGYVLIHDPRGLGGYVVSHVKPLTKKQREFLYGYFMDMNMKLKAERYLEDD